MIITKTPYRVSLFGGSTDYESYYKANGSLLLGFTIDKYCYVSVKPFPHFDNINFEAYYSTVEKVEEIDQIKNPGIRGTLRFIKDNRVPHLNNISVYVQNELPSRTGIGSSSSLIVGLLKAIYTMYGIVHDKRMLAEDAIHIERVVLKEPGGIQDQIWAAYGGINSIEIYKNGDFSVKPLPVDEKFLNSLKRSSVMFHTNQRNSFDVAQSHDVGITTEKKDIHSIARIAKQNLYNQDIFGLVVCIKESWVSKTRISDKISNENIQKIIQTIESVNGAGKLMGSGGSGFIYAIIPGLRDRMNAVRDLSLQTLDFDFSYGGSEVVYKE